MALIGKIREKSVLLVIVIFVALMAFVLGDWQNFSGGGDDRLGLGTIDGQPVDFNEFNDQAATFMEQDQKNAQQQQRPYTSKDQDASRDRAWNFLVESKVIGKEMNALGIEVGDNEFEAYLYAQEGFPVLPEFAQDFVDSLGRFDANMLRQRLDQLANSENPEEVKIWEDNKKYFTERREREKYLSVLKQGLYVTKAEAEAEYLALQEKKSISLVLKRYSDIPDEEITVNDEELRAFYEEHKNEAKYQAEFGSRELKFFDVKIEPSEKDVQAFEANLEKIVNGFKNAKNDSLYVVRNSDRQFAIYSSSKRATFKPESNENNPSQLSYPDAMDSVFKNATIGQVVGPYKDGENMRIAKVMDFSTVEMNARHILLSADKADSAKVEQTRKLADSLVQLINSDNFEEYVAKYSEDTGSKNNGGKIENFLEFEMVPEFSEFAKNEPIGKIGYVQTRFGFHIMENLERKEVKYPVLAVIQKTLKASEETIMDKKDEVFNLLIELDEAVSNAETPKAKLDAFDTIVKDAGYLPRPTVITENKPIVYGFDSKLAEDKMIELAFDKDSDVGTMCSSPIKDGDRYVIAIVSKAKDKGTPDFEDIEETMRIELIKEKKAERLMAKMNADSKTLTALAQELNTEVKKAEVTFSSAQIPQVGFEPEIIGAVFSGLKEGQKTIPLKGRNGVYVVQVEKVVKATATKDYSAEKTRMLQTQEGQVENVSKAALIKKANVVDNRRFNQIGIR